MTDSFDGVIAALRAALAKYMEHARKLEEKNASLARKIERLQRTASHDTEYGKVMAKRIIQEQER